MSEYLKLQAEIAELQKKAEALRKSERQGAIKQVNELVKSFGISAEEISFPNTEASAPRRGRGSRKAGKPGRPTKAGRPRRTHPSAGKKVAPKYADGKGNTWAGRGQQPKWLSEAIKNGATLEQFRIAA